MSYSDDKRRLEQMLPYLKGCAEGKNMEWPITRGNANTVAFRIREALRLARMYASDYPDLARYASDYAISVKDARTVTGRRRTPEISVPQEIIARLVSPPAPVYREEIDVIGEGLIRTIASKIDEHSAASSDYNDAISGKQSALSVVDTYRRYGSMKPTIRFPHAALSNEDLNSLFFWADAHQPRLMLMAADQSVTVAIFDSIVAEHSYRPADAEG